MNLLSKIFEILLKHFPQDKTLIKYRCKFGGHIYENWTESVHTKYLKNKTRKGFLQCSQCKHQVRNREKKFLLQRGGI